MKTIFWISLFVFSLLTLLFLIVSFASKKIETPEYKVIQTYGEVEVRLYSKMVVAKTKLTGNSFDNQGSKGFRTIANYIFGANEKNEKIAMTSPVVMSMGDTASMYFVMPKAYALAELPKPNSPNVEITEENQKTMAVIGFGGYATDKKIELFRQKLESVLGKNMVKTKGPFLFMGYNAPWDFINRRNEVAIELE